MVLPVNIFYQEQQNRRAGAEIRLASAERQGTPSGYGNNLVIMENIHKFLEDKIEIRCNTSVEEICRQEDGTFVLELNKGEKVACKYLIAAPGRAGAEWYTEQCAKMGLDFINNQVDIGVRVEVPAEVFKHITDEVYEAKFCTAPRFTMMLCVPSA